MHSQTALVTQGRGVAKIDSDRPIPQLRDDYILVKVAAVALNPTDWNHIDWFGDTGTLVGADYAGTVVEVGKKVTEDFKKGDRIAGFVHGGNVAHHEDGAFAEYITAKGDIQIKIPDNLSFEQAASLGCGLVTVGQGLYQSLGLPMPDAPTKEAIPILIYGGSTATGLLAIQFATLSGFTVYTTASPNHNQLLKSLGATEVFDYSSPTVAQEIFAVTGGKLKHVLDCKSIPSSAKICYDSMSLVGGIYASLLPVANFPRKDIIQKLTAAYTGIGESFSFGPKRFSASMEDFDFQVKHIKLSTKLLTEKKITPAPIELRSGGLEGILGGLDELRRGEVRGKKLVYRID